MKILMCNKFHFLQGGAERYLFDLCLGLENLNCEIIHFAMEDRRNPESPYKEYFVDNVDYDEALKKNLFSKIKTAYYSVYSLQARKKVGLLIDRYSPNIAHIHNIYHQISPSILQILKKRNIPVVMTLHDYKIFCPNYRFFSKGKICEKCKGKRYYNCILNMCLKESWGASLSAALGAYYHDFLKLYRDVDLFIAPSEFMYRKAIEYGMDKEKVLFLPHSIDLSQFMPKENKGKYILYVGKLSWEKGIKTFVESLKFVPSIQARIIGDGPQLNEMKKLASEYGLANVDFLGKQAKEDLARIMSEALFVVVPSEWNEPSGLVIYEAFASGKPVIASRVGGIPELVENEVNGLLFQPGNARELASKIEYLAGNPEKVKLFGDNAFQKITQVNNLKKHAMRIRSEYEKLISCKTVEGK